MVAGFPRRHDRGGKLCLIKIVLFSPAGDVSDLFVHSAVVAAEGHLVDSNLLNSIFDRIVERGGDFEVSTSVSAGPAKIFPPTEGQGAQRRRTAKVEELIPFGCVVGEQDAIVRSADRDGCAPDDYSTTSAQVGW
jgi:hypothetical protein